MHLFHCLILAIGENPLCTVTAVYFAAGLFFSGAAYAEGSVWLRATKDERTFHFVFVVPLEYLFLWLPIMLVFDLRSLISKCRTAEYVVRASTVRRK
jgi:hypothetical protein